MRPRRKAIQEAAKMHEIYTRFAEDYMAMPVIKGAKRKMKDLLVPTKHLLLKQ